MSTAKIDRFLQESALCTPFLVVDLDVVAAQYQTLRELLPAAEIFYAVKANPAHEILSLLADMGASFDVASRAEVDMVLDLGVDPGRVSYGNTIKKQADIAYAYERGVRMYTFDCEAELDKLAAAAPGSRVICRILVNNCGAEWPLSRKFGCDPEMARDLLRAAAERGLKPAGLAFHVGSQQTRLDQWDDAIARSAALFAELEKDGIELELLNIGGGLPAHYTGPVAGMEAYATAIVTAMSRHFGNRLPRTVVEPGRYIVGDAGVLQTEIVLISQKSYEDEVRWIYLDVGRFNGLAETEGEAIRYPIRTPWDGSETGPVVLAGPSCDSVDILYERANYQMPLSLQIGDKVQLLSTGAYTTTYSSVGFNGFDPLPSYYI